MKADTEIVIGEDTYKIGVLPNKLARPVFVRLSNVLGPALGEIIAAGDDADANGPGMQGIGAAIARLTAGLRDEDLEYLQISLFTHVQWLNPQGHWVPLRGIMEAHFTGEFGKSFKVLFAALSHNYGDYLKELGLTLPAALVPNASQPA